MSKKPTTGAIIKQALAIFGTMVGFLLFTGTFAAGLVTTIMLFVSGQALWGVLCAIAFLLTGALLIALGENGVFDNV